MADISLIQLKKQRDADIAFNNARPFGAMAVEQEYRYKA